MDMVKRLDTARTEFIESIQEQFGYEENEAEHIFDVYLKGKVIKLQAGIGRYALIHGAYWDKDVLETALYIKIH